MISTPHRWRAHLGACAVGVVALAACTSSTHGAPRTGPGSVTAASSPEAPLTPLSPSPTPSTLPAGVLASIKLSPGDAPSAVAAGFGSIWVETHRASYLYRINPSTDRITAKIDLGRESCGLVAVAVGRIWVGPCQGGPLVVVDPDSNKVARTLPAGGFSMATINGSPWIARREPNRLTELDPRTYRPIATVNLRCSLVVAGGGLVWTANPSLETGEWNGTAISGVDPKTHRVVKTIPVRDPGSYATMTYAFGRIWLKGKDDNKLIAIDPTTGKSTTYAIHGWSPLEQLFDEVVVSGQGSLWMRTSDGTVSRIDPATGKVTATYPADADAGGGYLAVDQGMVWIANFGTDTVWQVRIQA